MPIKWIKTKNGKNMPLDPVNIDEGDILYDREKHSSHWDTCTKQDQSHQSAPTQAASESVMNPYLTTKFNECVRAVQAGVGYEKRGADFLDAVEKTHKPKTHQEDAYDDDIPF